MLISLAWLNRLLDPPTLTGDEAERALTNAGFPLESREKVSVGGAADERLDVEITSNRGDCLCHMGLAREIAAATGRRLATREDQGPRTEDRARKNPEAVGGSHGALGLVENRAPDVCPRFTARIIRGVKVGASPAWLVAALESVGQRSINNVVDASNFVLFELGNPSHAFDLNTLAGKRLVVRYANEGEAFTALDSKNYKLKADELVVADERRAMSLAGVIGGLDSSVTLKTTDLLVEVATWDPATIRRAGRRLQIKTDASHRFERVVHPGTLDAAMERLCGLIVELAGGSVEPGMADAGRPVTPKASVAVRVERCSDLLGIVVPPAEMSRLLTAVDVQNTPDARGETLKCTIPYARAHDLTREVDLIEEVARLHGFDAIPIAERLSVTVAAPQSNERAVKEIGALLTGLGFYETVTFSFLTREQAETYKPWEARLISVDEERRKGAPYLRPSVVPSLLECRRVNQDAGNKLSEGVRLFELGSGFQEWEEKGKGWTSREFRSLAMVMDAADAQMGLRKMRGVIETLVRTLGGPAAKVEFAPAAPFCAAHGKDATALVSVNGSAVGGLTLIAPETQRMFGLDEPVVAAEILLDALVGLYPPKGKIEALPAFPGIERDLSFVVSEETAWAKVAGVVEKARPDKMVECAFVGVYRGKQVGAGKKSVTLRLRFQDPARTLRHEEVDPQVASVVAGLKREVGAELRA